MFILGIVGSIAGGKSTVSHYLATHSLGSRHIRWIDADKIAKSLLDDDDVKSTLISHFGVTIASDDGSLDRSALANLVFGDDDFKRVGLEYLESVIHPRVRQQIRQQLAVTEKAELPIAMLDVPLLYESKWHLSCDSIWCVDAPQDARIDRVKNRGWDAQELLDRQTNQLDLPTKRRLSNLVIENDSTITALHQIVDANLSKIMSDMQRIDLNDPHCRLNL